MRLLDIVLLIVGLIKLLLMEVVNVLVTLIELMGYVQNAYQHNIMNHHQKLVSLACPTALVVQVL